MAKAATQKKKAPGRVNASSAAAPTDQADNPSLTGRGYDDQYHDWQLVNDVIKGTRHLHLATIKYLPQEPRETNSDYQVRLKKSVFWNAYKRTVQGLTGMVFRRDPHLSADVPPILKAQWENLDLEGTHGDVFAREVFKTGLNDGHCFIYVDMPVSVVVDNPAATKADEAGRRPYWMLINKGSVINWRSTTTPDGQLVLTQATIVENMVEPFGEFGEVVITQYRVLTPGAFKVYRQDQQKKTWSVVESGTTSLDFIPLIPVYTNRTTFLQSQPPLLDLALLNLRHYRLQSDLDNILHKCSVPLLVAKNRRTAVIEGDTASSEQVISPNTLIDVDKDGDLKYVEPSGHAIALAQAEIKQTEAQMATLGLLLLRGAPQVQKTATQSALDYEAESSELAAMARGLIDALEQGLAVHAEYLGLKTSGATKPGGSVEMNTNFSQTTLDAPTFNSLMNMVLTRNLSIDTLWDLMMQSEMLPADFSPATERKLIAAANADQATAEPTIPPDSLPPTRSIIKPNDPTVV